MGPARPLQDIEEAVRGEAEAIVPPIPDVSEVVTTAEEAYECSARTIESWTPGTRSLSFSGFPGLGKTTAASRRAARALDGLLEGWGRTAVIALPRRDDVHEKRDALQLFIDSEGLRVRASVMLGRQHSDPSAPWYCGERERARSFPEAGQVACIGCPSSDNCQAFGFRRDQQIELEAAKSEPSVIFTTSAALPYIINDLPRPKSIPVIVDDEGTGSFGLDREVSFPRSEIERFRAAVEAVRPELARPTPSPDLPLPESIVAEILISLCRALLLLQPRTLRSRPLSRVADVVDSLPDDVHKSLELYAQRPEQVGGGWPWEQTHSSLNATGSGFVPEPHFTRRLLELAAHAASNRVCPGPFARREGRRVRVWIPNDELIRRARRGRVMWLGVGAMPTQTAEAINVDSVQVHGRPAHGRVIYTAYRDFYALGSNSRQPDKLSLGDRIAGALCKALHEKASGDGRTFAAVVKKDDRDRTMFAAAEAAGALVHYGGGHAATDDLAGTEWLLIRRHALSNTALLELACRHRCALNLSDADFSDRAGYSELRSFGPVGDGPHAEVRHLPEDPLARELARYFDAQFMLNAAGRARPLANPCTTLVVSGKPIPGLEGQPLSLQEIAREFDLDPSCLADLPEHPTTEEVGRAHEARVAKALLADPEASTEELAQAAKVGTRTTRRIRARIQPRPEDAVSRTFELLRLVTAHFGHTPYKSDLRSVAEVGQGFLPTARELAETSGLSGRYARRMRPQVRRALEDGIAPATPVRRDAAESLRRFLQAWLDLLVEEMPPMTLGARAPSTAFSVASAAPLRLPSKSSALPVSPGVLSAS